MAEETQFTYAAVDLGGRRVRGVVLAADDGAAFDQLRREGLSPLSLKPRAGALKPGARGRPPGDRECAEFLSSLADLLRAGADIRASLAILSDRPDRSPLKALGLSLVSDIGGGDALEKAFAKAFQKRFAFVASMVAAGEAAGDLPSGLERASEIVAARLKLRDQLISVLAYPCFVLVSAIVAVFVILLFIVPTIAPLAQDAGAVPPFALRMMILASNGLKANFLVMGVSVAAGIAGLLVLGGAGALAAPIDRLVFDGPARRTTRALVFGAFAHSLGGMLASGAPMTDALRLAIRSVPSAGPRRRLEPVAQAVQQGQSLSAALAEVQGFPSPIVRLATVGEASNRLGQMLARGGRLEEESAMRRIETVGRLAGPALIVFLGLLLGTLMASLLSGVSQLGSAALG